MAEGNLDVEISYTSKDELGILYPYYPFQNGGTEGWFLARHQKLR